MLFSESLTTIRDQLYHWSDSNRVHPSRLARDSVLQGLPSELLSLMASLPRLDESPLQRLRLHRGVAIALKLVIKALTPSNLDGARHYLLSHAF
ncbi:hypothetical protein PoB_003705300 [Plakobranchus ocellatus]|uniref:Uncharacterized protein n=1 Tax=Plakobranchus ocellatus TaxID=259542 RepID=A0AAV4AUP4_9GAST|nr:hypothetical protein PoB_003705300 [Plakobranchus ocellatus]